jgi:class 3 adenylate cyclase/tetratricopeptide (TPR) repeat protein
VHEDERDRDVAVIGAFELVRLLGVRQFVEVDDRGHGVLLSGGPVSPLVTEAHAERRLVTCLFIDIVASTALTRDLGPERMKRLVDDAFRAMSDVITARGGTIEKFVGDAVFVLFGAPTSHADDPERALRAASACTRWAAESGTPIGIRAGIETGEALIDLGATQRDRERMAVGECVNLASRLQSHAEPGQILVGPNCHTATEYVAEFGPPQRLRPKGFDEVVVWPLLRIAGGGRSALPFIGRQRELDLLNAAYGGVCAGQAKLALVIGPPGQGKSRLASEMVAPLRGEATILEARCRPGEENGAETPLRQLIASDIPDPTSRSIEARLKGLLPDANDVDAIASAIGHSVGVIVDPRVVALPRLEQREVLTSAWQRYLEALAARRPVIVWVEDIHWADPLVLRLIDRVSDGVGSCLMVLATARPEFAGSAHFRPGTSRLEIELGPLGLADALALARSASTVQEQDVQRAQGNPLFIVELARARLTSPNVPMTVQAVIGARLDELPAADRQLLQQAAAVGETFSVRDAALLTEREPAEVAAALGRLSHLRFIEPAGRSYRFHHVLVHDVAYGRLTAEERLRLHARYAREGLSADDVEARAHHWWRAMGDTDASWVWADPIERAGLRREALRTHLAAAARLIERNAQERALEVSTRAVTLADDPRAVAEAEAALGMAFHRNARGDEAWTHRLAAIDLYRRAGTEPPPALYADNLEIAVFNFGYFRELPKDAEISRLLEEGERAARAANDSLTLARILTMRALHDDDVGPTAEALQLIRSAGDDAAYADTLSRLAQAENLLGRTVSARSLLDEALARAARGIPINEPEALMWRTLLAFHEGDLDSAEGFASRLLDISHSGSAHTQQHALGTQALVLFGRGDWEGLVLVAGETEQLVDANPTAGFCLIGAAAIGQAAAGQIAHGRSRSPRLEELAERMVTEAPATRASILMLPELMAGNDKLVAAGAPAYDKGGPRTDRQIWDPFGLQLAICYALLARWDDLGPLLANYDARASDAPMLGALAEALREQMAAAKGGRRPQHARLRELGYVGLSELLSYRLTGS